jgi:hypothetical protein
MADAWPAAKATSSVYGDASYLKRLTSFLILAPVAPMFGIYLVLYQMFSTLKFRQILSPRVTNPELAPGTMSICNKLWRAIDDVLVILFGIDQPRRFLKSTRIVANAKIVLGISAKIEVGTKIQSTLTNTCPVQEDNIADALTLGHKTAENSCLVLLNPEGKLALLESSGILPNYKQLRFLDGRSGIATLILAIQAIGYVTSIVYRATHHLPVSPIEAIGFAFSMLVIVHSVVHRVGVLSVTSALVIYLNSTQEQEVLDKCETRRWSNVDGEFTINAALVGMVVVGSVVVAFTIFVEWHVLRISSLDAIGPILFLLSFITQSVLLIIALKTVIHLRKPTWPMGLLFFGSVMISFGGIVISIVATILNWQSDKFDSRTPSVIHNLPFLG